MIVLAAYGNVWLRAPTGPPPDLASSSTFHYVQSMTFVLDGTEIATDAAAWFQGLRDRGVRRLWLEIPDESDGGSWLADHLASAFAGGGRWLLLTTADAFTEAWQPRWHVDRDAPDRRIWQVTYVGERVGDVRPAVPAIGDATATLRQTLADAREFAARHLSNFVRSFDRALTALDGRQRRLFRRGLPLPQSYPRSSHALVTACDNGWVFGGMGSWNDAGFADEAIDREYNELSRRLWQAITTALVAAVNVDLG